MEVDLVPLLVPGDPAELVDNIYPAAPVAQDVPVVELGLDHAGIESLALVRYQDVDFIILRQDGDIDCLAGIPPVAMFHGIGDGFIKGKVEFLRGYGHADGAFNDFMAQ